MVCQDNRSLKKDDDVYTINFDRALEILREPKKAPRGSTLIKEFGKHPKKKKKMTCYEGKYGLYFKFGTKNVSIPDEFKDQKKIEALTPEKVAEIIDSVLDK